MTRIIEKTKNVASCAECFSQTRTVVEVEFENNKLKTVNDEENSGHALRVVKDGKIGFSTTTKEDDEDNLIKKALEVSSFGQKFDFDFPGTQEKQKITCYSDDIRDYSVSKMVDIGSEIIDAIRQKNPQILAFASIGKGTANISLSNSSGIDKSYKYSWFCIYGGAKITEEGNFLTLYDYKISNFLIGKEAIEKVKNKVLDELDIATINVPFHSGKYPVILSPAALSHFIVPITVSASGKSVQKGISSFRDKLGEKIFDERITLSDNGYIEGGIGSVPFDDEGIPTSKTCIIERGVLKNFYHNLATAKALEEKPTGNGMRGGGIGNIPSPCPTNLVISPGDTHYRNMIKDIKEGVFIDSLMGTFTSNHLAGQVSGNISLGYKIENGAIVGRIKDTMISVNIFEIFKNNIATLSKEANWRGNHCFPYILLNDIPVSSSRG